MDTSHGQDSTVTRPVLVIGGGIGGMAFALQMRKTGRDVVIVEKDPQWRVYGAGITVTGASYRAFRALGILPEMLEKSIFVTHGARIFTAAGDPIIELDEKPLEPGLPVTGGIMRPELHGIMSRRVTAAGIDVRLGVTVSSWADHGDRVDVTLSDGTTTAFDFAVGADGAFSDTRRVLFPEAPAPRYTGQYCWRIVAERPPEVDRAQIYVGDSVSAGLMPVSATHMYMWLLEPVAEATWMDEATQHMRLRSVMESFGGALINVRDQLGPHSSINVRPLDALLLQRPWHRGRIVLIGDAAHATTPHLASGAGMAVEDALVLNEELSRHPDLADAFEAFTNRRFERCRMVVESSVAIGQMQQQDQPTPDKLNAMMAAAQHKLLEAI